MSEGTSAPPGSPTDADSAAPADEVPAAASPPSPARPPALDGYAGLADALEALRTPPSPSWAGLFVLSLAAFVFLRSSDEPLRKVLLIAAVLLVHEAGHAVAMRLLGYRDVRVFFVPFFGALTTARSGPGTRRAQAVVALAGPLPGIVAAAAVMLSPLAASPRAWEAAEIALFVNAFNLLPIGFLDGGRLLDQVVFQRHPLLEGAFAALSGVAFAAAAVGFEDWVLGVLALTSLSGVSLAYRRAKRARALRGALAPGDPAALPREQLDALYAAAVELAPQGRPAARAGLMRELHARATVAQASVRAAAGFTAIWLVSLVGTVAVGAVAYALRPPTWAEVSEAHGRFTLQMPGRPEVSTSDALVVNLRGRSYAARSIQAEPADAAVAVARALAAQDEAEILEEGPAPGDPESHRVRARLPTGMIAIYEVHDAPDRMDLLISVDGQPPAHEDEARRFLASYRRTGPGPLAPARSHAER